MMTLKELSKRENLSTRSYNICGYNKLHTLSEIIDYYKEHKSFQKLKSCGRRSDEELISICKKYQSAIHDNSIKRTDKDPLEEILSTLTRDQRAIINSFIVINIERLSARSKNALTEYLNKNLNIKNFAEEIFFSKDFNMKNIKNVGKKSISELEIYFSNIKNFIYEVSQTNNEKHLISLKNKFLIQGTFNIKRIPNEILESESIFLITDFLINNYLLFDKTQTIIVQNALILYKDQKIVTLDEISEKVNLSSERVRQRLIDSVADLFNKLSFLKKINDDLFKNYGIDTSLNIIEINESSASKINKQSNTNYSKEFISYIIAVYLSDDFIIIGNIEDVILPRPINYSNRHKWSNFYIANKVFSKLDFISFTNDISERLNERIVESYSFNFKSYLSKFVNELNIEIIEVVLPLAEKIMDEEFSLYLDRDDNITFERNTTMLSYEFSYKALESLGKPSSVKEITDKVLELYPNYETDEDKVRVSMKRKDGFVPIGKKSVYGLKKWEKEIDSFRGGSIRDIVEEYLMHFDLPKHIFEITKYVLSYRINTYQRSIHDNLKADKSNTFIFFNQGFIGLNSKIKNYNIEKYKRLPVQLGKTLISKHKKGLSREQLLKYLQTQYKLEEKEGLTIISNLDYFKNENQTK